MLIFSLMAVGKKFMLKNYVKIAFKVLLRRKFFTFISLFAISFTLIVLVVATALLDYTFAPFPPENKQDRTLHIVFAEAKGPNMTSNGAPGYGLLDGYCRNLPGAEKLSTCTGQAEITTFLNDQKVRTYLKRTDSVFWEIFEFQFVEGAPFTARQEKNADFVAVINEATRARFFGSSPAIGKNIELDGQRFQVIGVVKNVPISRRIPFADVWVPLTTQKSDGYRKELRGEFLGIILARSSADFPAIKTELASRMRQVQFPDPQFTEMRAFAETKLEIAARMLAPDPDRAGGYRVIIGFASIAVLFMLLPTVNLININVSRILERSSEIGVRKAFGASSWTLVGQFIIENIILTLVGAVVALVVSWGILQAISHSQLLLYAELQLNWRIFGYGFVLALFFGLLSGVYPAWKMSRLHPVQALKGGVR